MLYLPHRPLQRFASWSALSSHLKQLLSADDTLAELLKLIELTEQVPFRTTLRKRLSDPLPDLEIVGHALSVGLFTDLVSLYLRQLRADARYLVVPVSDFDEQVKWKRIETWESVGSNLLQLAALFVPVINQLMLAKMIAETVEAVCEGVADWTRGHQHEAVEHLLGVAEVIAVNALIAGGGTAVARAFRRSAYVDELVPITVSEDGGRLWAHELAPFRSRTVPLQAVRQRNGLYTQGERRWWRHLNDFYEVHRDSHNGEWRLLRADGRAGFAPSLQWNGDCGWRAALQRPQEWHGEQAMLAHLWPPVAELDANRLTQVLQVANVEEPALYRLVAEQRELPVALRDTLERYALNSRIDVFFAALQKGEASAERTFPLSGPCWKRVLKNCLPVSE